ncbi:MAG TPA: hypothetical protein VLI43_02230 [Gemmatimonadaceae bacterium]|nr:hypothetical protein [Gemmatimonadaceae bacterium]
MRFPVFALALKLGSVAACSSDFKPPTESTPVRPLAVTHVDLTFSGSVPLFTSRANAINDAGVVVGSAAVNPSDPPRAVIWRPPGYAFEFLPGGSTTTASSANAIGRDGVIGGQIGCNFIGIPVCRPVYWRDGVVHELDGFGQVRGVCPCDSHTLVGQVLVNGLLHGALWIDEVLIDVGTPAGFSNAELVSVAHGFIVGNAFNGDQSTHVSLTAFRWAPSSGWTPLVGGSFVSDVNSSGSAVGAAPFPTIWLNGSNTATSIPDGVAAMAINDSSVVGGSFLPGNVPFFVAAIWTQADGWTMIGNEMNPTITDINNSNQVVGYWHDQGQDHGTIWEP